MSTETTTGTGARPPPDNRLPAELRERIPPLYATEETTDPIVQAKLFTPWTTWAWFVTEFDGQDTCFGLVSGHEVELGYFNLAELEALEGPGGHRIERDLHFEPQPLSKVRQDLDRMRDGPDGFTVHENNEEFHESANGSVASDHQVREPPSPFDRPGIHLIKPRLDTAIYMGKELDALRQGLEYAQSMRSSPEMDAAVERCRASRDTLDEDNAARDSAQFLLGSGLSMNRPA